MGAASYAYDQVCQQIDAMDISDDTKLELKWEAFIAIFWSRSPWLLLAAPTEPWTDETTVVHKTDQSHEAGTKSKGTEELKAGPAKINSNIEIDDSNKSQTTDQKEDRVTITYHHGTSVHQQTIFAVTLEYDYSWGLWGVVLPFVHAGVVTVDVPRTLDCRFPDCN